MAVASTALCQSFSFYAPLPYNQHNNPFYHHQPSLPPHFRPFGYQPYKTSPYQPYYQSQPETYHSSDLSVRSGLPNPYVPDYPSFYQRPQYNDIYHDLDELNRIPVYRDPLQIIPSRFPPSIEGFVQGIQNRFSVYNPVVPLELGPAIIIPADNATNTTAAPSAESSTEMPSATETEEKSTEADSEVDSATAEPISRSDDEVATPSEENATEVPENVTEGKEDTTEASS